MLIASLVYIHFLSSLTFWVPTTGAADSISNYQEINRLNDLSWQFLQVTDLDSAAFYADLAEDMILKLRQEPSTDLKASNLKIKGAIAYYKSDYQTALNYYHTYMILYQKLDSTNEVAKAEGIQGQLEHQQHQPSEAWAELQDVVFRNFVFMGLLVVTVGSLVLLVIMYLKKHKAGQLISAQKKEIEQLNLSLEQIVLERTEKLATRNAMLEEYATFNAHQLRAPVARMMGLLNIYRDKSLSSQEQATIRNNLFKTAEELDGIIHQMQKLLDTSEKMTKSYPRKIKNTFSE